MTEVRILAGLLRDFCKAHLVLSEEGLIEVGENAIVASCVDAAHTCMSSITLPVDKRNVKVLEPEARTFDLKKLLATLKFSAYDDEVMVTHDGQRIVVKAGKFTYRQQAPDVVPWPKIPTFNLSTAAKVPIHELKKLFKVSESNSIRLELRPGALSFRSGDSSNETELEISRDLLSDIMDTEGQANRATYDKQYLQPIIALANDEATLSWGRDLPIIIRPRVNNHVINVQPTFYLAPLVDDDEDEPSEEVASDE